MLKVLTGGEMRAVEQEVVARGTTLTTLMERAGLALAQELSRTDFRNILVLVGPGNNGGDGLIAAKQLADQGRGVSVYTFHRQVLKPYSGKAIESRFDGNLPELTSLLGDSDVIVDALLGIGQRRPPDDELAGILQCVNEKRLPSQCTVSVDIPTGVDADSGKIWGEAFRADETLCMGFLKCGNVVYPGGEYSGKAKILDVGIPLDLVREVTRVVPQDQDIARLLPTRSLNGSKGSSGTVLVVTGSGDFLGAPALVAAAAYRAGAGLVNLAVPASIKGTVASNVREAIFTPLPETDGRIAADAVRFIQKGLKKAKSLVFGPGIGLSDSTVGLTQETLRVLSDADKPVLFDADGLNALSRIPRWWETNVRMVITPHPGEMSRLTGLSVPEIQNDRLSTAQRFAEEWNVVVVLKGAGTLVASPEGAVSINPTGGPNLATAGTGDVLSGVIGSLLAQGLNPFEAAVAGVYLHGRAGDLVRAQFGDVGTIASDLLAEIPQARMSLNE